MNVTDSNSFEERLHFCEPMDIQRTCLLPRSKIGFDFLLATGTANDGVRKRTGSVQRTGPGKEENLYSLLIIF